jgi:hypothetical protein
MSVWDMKHWFVSSTAITICLISALWKRHRVEVQRYYPQLRLYGADLAVPLPWFTLKSEAAYFTSTTAGPDEYALYLMQLERQVKEWSFVGGYAGEVVTRSSGNPLEFAPDRGSRDPFSATLAGPSTRIAASRSKPPCVCMDR